MSTRATHNASLHARGSVNVLLRALDAASGPVPFFLRDDDAGWDDARLFALLDCTQQAGVPIDLAVIPQSTGPLRWRARRSTEQMNLSSARAAWACTSMAGLT